VGASVTGRTATGHRVLLAGDQRIVRDGLAMLLGLLPDVEVAGTAALAARLQPDVVLMDLRMPRCDGVEATRLLREQAPASQWWCSPLTPRTGRSSTRCGPAPADT
jgi:CheY-like chemotaxis protein